MGATPCLRQTDHLHEETENDTEQKEGNAFTGALAKAKKQGKKTFSVDGKEFEVTEDLGGMGLGMGHDDFEDINQMIDEQEELPAAKKSKKNKVV